MKYDGTYTIIIKYGESVTNEAKTTFELTGGVTWMPNYSTPQPIPENNSKCGPGTVFDTDANSCVLNTPPSVTSKINENTQLKIENKKLKNQINELQLKIVNLQNIINEQLKVIMDVLVELKSN